MAEKPHDDVLPPELALVRAFANTLDVEDAADALGSPAALRDWLVGQGLIEPGTTVNRRDLAAAIEVRDALRRLLLVHSGYPLDPAEAAQLDPVLARWRVEVGIDGSGDPILRAPARGVGGALGRMVAGTAVARLTGTWERLKLCPAEDCLWAFYDHSKNRSRRWCSMDVCGNRTKTRSYRQRRRGT